MDGRREGCDSRGEATDQAGSVVEGVIIIQGERGLTGEGENKAEPGWVNMYLTHFFY